MAKKKITKKEQRAFQKDKEKEDRKITDDFIYHLLIKVLIGAIIFYFSYSFYISTLVTTTFVKLSMIILFQQIADIVSVIPAFFIIRAISDKLDHNRKSLTYLNGKMSFSGFMFQIWNMTINAILIMIGFYVLLKSSFYDNFGILLVFYIVIRVSCALIALGITKLSIKYRKSKIALGFIIFTIVFYIVIIVVAIWFLFL